ncbi:MAG: acyl-CoA dehydrogenase family protein [Candidatus Binatia bacterium]
MGLVATEEQRLLRSTAEDFVKKESPIGRVRELRDSQDSLGFSRKLWSAMAELGWQGILVPEAYGGLGMGYAEIACVLEALGRNLVPEPLLSTALLGANAVLVAGTEEQKNAVLPGVANGSLILSLAWQERGSGFKPFALTSTAKAVGDGYLLEGEKTLVLDGHAADHLVVSARSFGGPADRDGVSLFLVEAGTPGLEVVRQSTMDLRNAALVKFEGVELPASAMMGEEGGAAASLEAILDGATLGLCAEMLGAMQAAFEMTLEYLKTREQFGVVIGSFQALKHRAAQIFVEIELSRSAVLGACEALDGGSPEAAEAVSIAKAKCSDTAVLVGYEGIQMHGGIGMTDEHDIGFYVKRAKAAELTFGDAAWHRDRFATLRGF